MNSDFQNNVEKWLDGSLLAINDLFKPTEKVKKTDSKNLKFSEIKSYLFFYIIENLSHWQVNPK